MIDNKTNNVFQKHISFGGLMELNDSTISLRNKQIKDGVKIHTCNDYGNAIEVIKEANPSKIKTTIILKVYFNYPSSKNRRYRSIISQIDEFIERLSFIPSNLILQMCCYFPLGILKKDFFSNFLERVNREYGVKKIFFEYYPVYNYKFDEFKYLFYKVSEKITFGFTGYYNLYNRVLNKKSYDEIYSLEIPFIPIGILGKNKKRDIEFDTKKLFSKDQIDTNLIFLMSQVTKNKNIFGITETSNYSNYQDLKYRFTSLEFNEDIYNHLALVNYNFINRDQYGGEYTFSEYIKNPRNILSKSKNLILKNKSNRFFFE